MKTDNDKNYGHTNDPPIVDNIKLTLDAVSKLNVTSEVSSQQGVLQRSSDNENEKKLSVSNVSEAEEQNKKLLYPKSAFFIVGDQFSKNFYYSALRDRLRLLELVGTDIIPSCYPYMSSYRIPLYPVLVLYLTRQLGFNNDDATIIFHTYIMSSFFLSIVGAFISDSWLGKFRTIFYSSLIIGVGAALITISTTPLFNFATLVLTTCGLGLIALGSGAASACMSAFGGDQFKVPEQMKKLRTFFSLFYFFHNAGSLVAYTITPIFREDVQCFGEKDCYFLAFGIANVVVVTSLIVFALARPLYKIQPPAGNMITLVTKTISNAIATRCREKRTNPRKHWLDYANKKYDRQLIDDIKAVMHVLVLLLPLPFFWALFDQQGSRWTIQATHMNGDMGWWNIKPDQMPLLSPLLFLAFLPLNEIAFYPILSVFGIRRQLQKITLGGIFAGIAFIISGLVELKLEQTYPTLPSAGIAQLRVYNGELCDYTITTNSAGLHFDISSLDTYINTSINIESSNGIDIQFQFSRKSDQKCPILPSHNCVLKSEKSYYMFINSRNTTHPVVCAEDIITKPKRGYPLGRTLANVDQSRNIQWKNSKGLVEHTQLAYEQNLIELQSDTYQLLIDNVEIVNIKLEVGGIYTILLAEEFSNTYRDKVVIVTDPNSVSMLWLIPQYVVMALGETMFLVNGDGFCYTEAPLSMKTVVHACWLLTMAFGNLIIIIIAELSFFDSQASEFFLFAGLMFADMILFMFIAYLYKPNNPAPNSDAISPSVLNAASEIDG